MSSSKYPLVSVLMTAYNREDYIAAAIESVIASQFTDWELIITDDCSTDQTLSIAMKFADNYTNIHVFKNVKNMGDYQNRNLAASYAKGKYLKYLDADDLIYPYGLGAMVNALEHNPDAAFGLSFSSIDELFPYPRLVLQKEIIRTEYLGRGLISVGPSASIIKTEAFRKMGGFTGKQFIGDIEFWLMLSEKFHMVQMAPALIWYRRHEGQQIEMEKKRPEVAVERFLMSKRHLINNKQLFTEAEYKFAYCRLKRNYSRKNLREFFKDFNFRRLYFLNKKAGLNITDTFGGFLPYLHIYKEKI